MAFRRAVAPTLAPSHADLTAAMAGIGMGFATQPMPDANIEDTLWFASSVAMDDSDLRVLSVLATWFGAHHPWVNADRLTKLASASGSRRVRALWSALATWQAHDRRFARLAALERGPRIDLLATGTSFQIARHGEDERFRGTRLRVPANALRDRHADVLAPGDLARRHSAYQHRVMIGPTYRADLWAALVAEPSLSATPRSPNLCLVRQRLAGAPRFQPARPVTSNKARSASREEP